MTRDDSSMLRFADFEFDVRSGELRRGDAVTRLEPQPARVLALLVEHRGEVVTRTEIQNRVWSGDTFVDFEHGLNYCIARIRTALGDSASEPRFVETLPRRGYRFIAPVHTPPAARAQATDAADDGGFTWQVQSAAEARAAAPVPDELPEDAARADRAWPSASDAPAGRRRWSPLTIAVAIGFAIVATWGTLARRTGDSSSAPFDSRPRIAVVLFDNETGVADYDRLAQTLTDATVARLATDSSRLAVIGNAPILRQPRASRDLTAIGRALDVRHVVLGQIQNIDGRLRITTHLIRVPDQAHVWAKRFEPAPADTATLDHTIPDAVAEGVATRLLGP